MFKFIKISLISFLSVLSIVGIVNAVTYIMVPQGGTGVGILKSNTLLVGNGINAVATTTYTVPLVDGSVNQTLATNGSGVLSWSTIGASAGRNAGINVEVLSADKTIIAGTDSMYQYLDPSGADRIITLDTAGASAGDRFVIKNNGGYTVYYYLQINQGATVLDNIHTQGSKIFIFDGTNWQGADNGSKDVNVGIGQYSSGYANGVAVGPYASGHSNGAAVGYFATGYLNGAAVGYYTKGYTNGVAIGQYASGYTNGTAVGYYTKGQYNGVALGYKAGTNLGTQNPGGNILLGYQAGDNLTTGTYNIVLGYDVDAPAIGSTQTLNIGNLIYGTGLDGIGTTLSSGNIGIGTTTPGSLFSIGNTNGINFSTATSTFSSTGGINLSAGCFAVNGTCVTGGGGGGSASASGVNAGINVEVLSADKTITAGTDPMYQYLDPNGANRIITMATSTASTGDRFVIRHNGAYTVSTRLQINQGTTALDYIYAQGSKVFIFDGTDWQGADNGVKDSNMTIGVNTQGYVKGTAVGNWSSGYSYGVGVGYSALGFSSGVAVGYNTSGTSNGVAVGRNAFGSSNGVAVGYFSNGPTNGVALGYQAIGRYNGVALGYRAGASLGSQNPAGNVLLGYQAGDNLTTGTYNIVLGYDVDAPAIGSTQTLNIGNLIYGTGLDGIGTTLSTGNIGIGTTTPAMKLSVQGPVLAQAYYTYSEIYEGDALSDLSQIKPEANESGTWQKVDHSSLGNLEKKIKRVNKKPRFKVIKTKIGTTTKLLYKIGKKIISRKKFEKMKDTEKYDISTSTRPYMNLSGLTLKNTKAVLQLLDKVNKLKDENTQQRAEIIALKIRMDKLDGLGTAPVEVSKKGKLLSAPLWAGFSLLFATLFGVLIIRKNKRK